MDQHTEARVASNKDGVAFKIVLANLATNADLDDSLFQFPASRVEQP